jgi:hypothetical protein
MKLIGLGSHVRTDQGDGYCIGRTMSVTDGDDAEDWAKPGRSKDDPVYTIQLFDGSLCTNQKNGEYPPVDNITTITRHSIDNDPNVPAGLRSFLLGLA